jgi:hypothetical protein
MVGGVWVRVGMVGGVWVRVVSRGRTRPEAEVEAGGREGTSAFRSFIRRTSPKKKEEPRAHTSPSGKRRSLALCLWQAHRGYVQNTFH